MKLLHILPSVDPRAGGPLEGVRVRGRRLLELGHQVEVASLDAPGSPLLARYGLPVHGLGSGRGGYGYSAALTPWLARRAADYDAVVVHGLWQYHSFGAWRALRSSNVPYFVFTHGMLDPWFRHAYPLKHVKKLLYWPWADYRVLRDAKAVLFTSEEERRAARLSFPLYKANEVVVPYGASGPADDPRSLRETFFARHPALRGKTLLLFLGRIHPKKGCDLLIQAFSKFTADDSLHLVLAGPENDDYAQQLRAQADRLGLGPRITWTGMLQGESKWAAFAASDIFVLPSHQENFGIAVVEALACGLPVLVSDKVNIWREIEQAGAGMVDDDTEAGTEKLLRTWLGLPAAAKSAYRAAARQLYNAQFTVDAMANGLLNVIRQHG